MRKIVQFATIGIFVQGTELIYSLNNLFIYGIPINKDISLLTMILLTTFLYYIAAKYLTFHKLIILSLTLSVSFSVFQVVWFLANDTVSYYSPHFITSKAWGMFWKINYKPAFGIFLYQFIAITIAFIFSITINGIILLCKKFLKWIQNRNFNEGN